MLFPQRGNIIPVLREQHSSATGTMFRCYGNFLVFARCKNYICEI